MPNPEQFAKQAVSLAGKKALYSHAAKSTDIDSLLGQEAASPAMANLNPNWKRRLCGMSELTELLGISRQRVDQLTRQKDFPAPYDEVGGGRVWRMPDIDKWMQKTGRK